MCLCSRCGRMLCHNGRECLESGLLFFFTFQACLGCRRIRNAPGEAVGVIVPYSFKLLLQEIAAMGIDVRIETGPADRRS